MLFSGTSDNHEPHMKPGKERHAAREPPVGDPCSML